MKHTRDKRWNRRTACGLLSLSIAASVACGKARETEEKPEPTVVKTALADEGSITEWLELQGRVAPPYDRDATLAPQVPGRIVALVVRVGELVKEGAVVARVETGALDDDVRAAEAAVRRSEADVVFKRGVAQRSRDLVTKGVASREEAESADAAAVAASSQQAQDAANLTTARRRHSWSELRAPFAGVVVRVDRRPGDFVDGTAATPVLEIAAADGWEIVASTTPSELQRLRSGQSASVEGPGEPSDVLLAAVTEIARAVDPATGAGDVRLRPRSRPPGIALGTPVRIRIAVRVHAKAVLVPREAIRKAADGSTEIVIVEAGIAHVRKIETAFTESGRVEVISGLAAGAHVVIEDPIGIAEGAALTEEFEADFMDSRPREPAPRESPSLKK